MKRWSFATNILYKKSCFILEEAPFYIFLIQDSIMFICSIIPPIPIPFGKTIKVKDKEDNKEYLFSEYYGDLRGLFHCFICEKIVNWSFKKIKDIQVDYPYDKMKELFYDESPESFEDFED